MNVYISPTFDKPDVGEGGIRRVVEAQKKWLPKYGWNVVDSISECDVAAYHGGNWHTPPAGVPVVSHTHGLYWDDYYRHSKAYGRINQDVIKALRQADVTTAPSEWVAQTLRRNLWLDPVVLYHGIEPDDWFVNDKNDGYVLWNKTRIDPICDPTPVTELAKRSANRRVVTTFADNRNLPLPTNIEVVGRQTYEEAKETIRRAGVYLSTSRETFGIGTLEALAAGVPVLGFDYGGNSEIVVHKEHGYLAKPGDYDDLASGLEYIYKHRGYLSHAARAYVVKEFAWEGMIAQYAILYNRLAREAQTRPKLSVIIPFYNLARYLPEAVDSVKQACEDITHEIIVVDDASDEPVPDIVYNTPGVTVHRNEENQYLAETLNVGLRLSRGEYVVNLDADNRLDNLNLIVNALDADRSLDIAYGRLRVFADDDSGRSYVSPWPPDSASVKAQLNRHNQIHSSAVYRRKIAERVAGYRRRCRRSEDADFWSRSLIAGAKARRVTNSVTLEYRLRRDSMSNTYKDWAWETWYGWGLSANRLAYDEGPVRLYDTPKVSIIIPVGPGHEKYLPDALDSIQAQNATFPDWEVIVINDTGKQLHLPYAWARAFNGFGKGASHARNLGIAASRSDLVLYLDADDFLHPNALHYLYSAYVAASDDNVFVYSDWYVAETSELRTASDFDPARVLESAPFSVTCLYNKHTLNKKRIRWDESLTQGWEDWDYAFQVISAGMCGLHLPLPMLHYRVGSGTLRSLARDHEEEIRLKIKDKYNDYYTGEKKLVPGCCGGGRYASAAVTAALARRQDTMPTDLNDETQTTLMEYTPPEEWTGTRSFLGRGTGIRYRFGVSPEMSVRRVHNDDVAGFEALGYFKSQGAKASVAPLKAEGPPTPKVAAKTATAPATPTAPVKAAPAKPVTAVASPATTPAMAPAPTPAAPSTSTGATSAPTTTTPSGTS